MLSIREIVRQAMSDGYLTVTAENQLRQLLRTKFECSDLNAFMSLQQAVMDGQVRQESRQGNG
ncbi:MAG TPA: hypothetical protein DDZ80_23750 [Cyanobacteria bacterium UBA8803]|nr:hypothetical protein [Cyanobacteria bacterium UBA9273]HBL61334.1 hypothetical protein [Cyanobacteria bacterium UBA8803]